MKRLRVSLGRIMLAVVFLVVVALASLTHPTTLSASLVFSVSMGTLCLSLVGIAFRHDVKRSFWEGYAACGWVGFLLQIAGFLLKAYITLGPNLLVGLMTPTHPPQMFTFAEYTVFSSWLVMAFAYAGAVISRAIFRDRQAPSEAGPP